MRNKKGQFEALGSLAVGIAVLAITLVIAFLIMSQGITQATKLVTATTTTNESVSGWARNGTITSFTFSASAMPSTLSCGDVYNGSTGGLVGPANYTCNQSGIIFLGDNSTNGWNTTALVTYTHKQPDAAINATRTLTNATQDIPGWVPLIVIAMIGSILLGLVALFRRN